MPDANMRACPRCGEPGGIGYCPKCHGPLGVNRTVGWCAACNTAVVRLADEENMASCVCGKTKIPHTFMDANRQMSAKRTRPFIAVFKVDEDELEEKDAEPT